MLTWLLVSPVVKPLILLSSWLNLTFQTACSTQYGLWKMQCASVSNWNDVPDKCRLLYSAKFLFCIVLMRAMRGPDASGRGGGRWVGEKLCAAFKYNTSMREEKKNVTWVARKSTAVMVEDWLLKFFIHNYDAKDSLHPEMFCTWKSIKY